MDLNPLAVQEEHQNLFPQRPYPGLKEAIMVLKKELDAKELWDRVSWNVSAMIERVSGREFNNFLLLLCESESLSLCSLSLIPFGTCFWLILLSLSCFSVYVLVFTSIYVCL